MCRAARKLVLFLIALGPAPILSLAQNPSAARPTRSAPQLYEGRVELRVTGLRYASEWRLFGDMPGPTAKPKDGEVLLVVAFELRDPKTRKLDTDAQLSGFGLTDQSGATYASSVASTDLREMAFSVPPGTKPRTARIGGLDFDVARLSVAAQKP